MKNFIWLFSFGILATALARAEGVPAYIEITDLAVNGGGCPAGSVSKNIAVDKKSFTLFFSEYIAEIAPGLKLGDARKACQITLNLATPPGWRFAVAGFTYRGFLDFDASIQGEHRTSYYFQGQALTGSFSALLAGPQRQDFNLEQAVEGSDAIWSSCAQHRAFNIKTSMWLWNTDKLSYPNAMGVMGTDTLDGQFQNQEWRLIWEKCDE